MTAPFGLFDVDCRELDQAGAGFCCRPRVEPIAARVAQLYAAAGRSGAPLVFTTCCSGKMPQAADLTDALYVPLSKEDDGWRSRVGAYKRFYLAKNAYGDPKVNAARRAFDMFQDNENAVPLLTAIDADKWVVFGNGFDLCVGSAVRGILAAGLPVEVIADVRISSAGGTPESERQTIDEMKSLGARIITLDAFLRENG